MKAIILAAGQGKRMLSSTKDLPKCLVPLNGSTVLERLIRQLLKFDITDISVVVGYHASLVISHIRENIGHEILFIENCGYQDDVNILSLSLAVKRNIAPCYVFEADCVFDDKCFELLLDPAYEDRSVWFSCGDFMEGQHGGILKGDENGRIVDIKIVDAYRAEYYEYKKMIGVMKIGPGEIDLYAKYLLEACQANTRQYYHMPWIEHIDELESYLCDMGHLKLASFNTVEDYSMIKEMFANEVD